MNLLLRISLCLLLASSSPVFAWGRHAHSVIAGLSEHYLDPGTSMQIASLLDGQSLAEASNWADSMRGNSEDERFWGYEFSANWHFIDIPAGMDLAHSPAAPRGDAYTALLAFTAILTERTVPEGAVSDGMRMYVGNDLYSRESKSVALRFILHLIADLHQPLHVGYPQDRGGNDIRLDWPGSPDNLHALWDRQLANPRNESVARHLKVLRERQSAEDAGQALSPEAWIAEALALREEIYRIPADAQDAGSYLKTNAVLAEQRMLLAAYRTAAYLNALFNGELDAH